MQDFGRKFSVIRPTDKIIWIIFATEGKEKRNCFCKNEEKAVCWAYWTPFETALSTASTNRRSPCIRLVNSLDEDIQKDSFTPILMKNWYFIWQYRRKYILLRRQNIKRHPCDNWTLIIGSTFTLPNRGEAVGRASIDNWKLKLRIVIIKVPLHTRGGAFFWD